MNNIHNKILRAINEGVMNALVDYDEEQPIHINKVLNTTLSTNKLIKNIYLLKLQDMLPDPTQIGNMPKEQAIKFINTAKLYYKKYGVKYNPHLDEIKFKNFIFNILEYLGNKANLNWIDTSEVTTMEDLFAHSRFNGDISEWNTSNVMNMEGMFNENSVFNGDISEWDVSNVTDMNHMFCNSNFNKDISKWYINRVNTMAYMFYKAKYFELDLSKWDVEYINTEEMFENTPIQDNKKYWPINYNDI